MRSDISSECWSWTVTGTLACLGTYLQPAGQDFQDDVILNTVVTTTGMGYVLYIPFSGMYNLYMNNISSSLLELFCNVIFFLISHISASLAEMLSSRFVTARFVPAKTGPFITRKMSVCHPKLVDLSPEFGQFVTLFFKIFYISFQAQAIFPAIYRYRAI